MTEMHPITAQNTQNVHETGTGIRNAIYGMVATLVLNLGVGIWYAAQLDARVGSVERQQQSTTLLMDRLNDAREKSDIHLTQVDGSLHEMNGKIDTILDIVQRMEQNAANALTTLQQQSGSGGVAMPPQLPLERGRTGH